MSGGGGNSGGGGSSAPSNTTANNTETVINQVPQYEESYMSNLLGQAATEAAQPYQQFPGPQVAGFDPQQTQAFQNISNLIGSGAAGAAGTAATGLATDAGNTASGISGAGSPWLTAAGAYNPAAAAAPYSMASAATNTPQGISAFMSPYLQNNIAGLESAAHQNWDQFTAPGVNNSFISAGQSGSGRNEQVLGQQANLANQSLTGQIAAAENQAYTTAGNQAASAASNLSGLGSLAGTAAASEASNLQNIGTGLGNLALTQAGAQGTAGANLANVANTVQNTGITGDAALQASGQTQQNLAQTNLNAAMTNFQNQNLWPEQQAGFMSNIIHGLPSAGTSATTSAQSPATTNQIGSLSPLSSLAGSFIGAGAALGHKQGGLIKGYADGGQVNPDVDPDSFAAKHPQYTPTYTGPSPITAAVNYMMSPHNSNPAPGAAETRAFLSSLFGGNSDPQAPPMPSGASGTWDAQPIDTSNGIPISSNAPISDAINPPSTAQIEAAAQSAMPRGSGVPASALNPPSPLPQAPAPPQSSITGLMGHSDAMPAQQTQSSGAPSDGSTDYERNLSASIMTPAQSRNYQLLMMAKGFLTPAHSGAEALGNAIGNYGQSGMEAHKLQVQQQEALARLADTKAYRQGMLQNKATQVANQGQHWNAQTQRWEDQSGTDTAKVGILQQNANTNAGRLAVAQQNANTGAAREQAYANMTASFGGTKMSLASIAQIRDESTDPAQKAAADAAINSALQQSVHPAATVNQAGQTRAAPSVAPVAPKIPSSLAGMKGVQYSPTRQQYRDADGNNYDASGNPVK
jgi:hypothetical protein